MSKTSAEFGRLMRGFLKHEELTLRAAALKSGVSAAYWKDMGDGRVPSEGILERISAAFENLDVNELRAAAGYLPKSGDLDAVRAVEFALRGHSSIPEEGKKQILDFVRKIENIYRKE